MKKIVAYSEPIKAAQGHDFRANMAPRLSEAESISLPLCVDADGTLVKTDMLVERACELLTSRPWYVFLFALWLFKGQAYLKQRVTQAIRLDVSTLPYHLDLLEFLRDERGRGRSLVLMTAANEQVAGEMAAHLKIFDQVLASDHTSNLKDNARLYRLQETFGEKGFGYVGKASLDVEIWRHASEVIVVNATESDLKKLSRLPNVTHVFPRRGNRLKLFLKAIRIHQWVKNLLLFAPLVLAHRIGNGAMLLKTLIGFLCFSVCASSVYILNDILDLKADREHPTKRDRPFAAGDLDISHGLLLMPLLLVPGFGIAAFLSLKFLAVLTLYYLLTLGYSLYLKRIALLDVSTLAILYTIRLFAGSALTEVVVSQWLLAFSMFLFFSLCVVKRSSELYNARQRNLSQAAGRGYVVADREQLAMLGTASGYCAVLVFTLYINSSAVLSLYTHPTRLWLVCPLVFYWISRIWLLAHRGEVNEDPILFAMKDKPSYVIGGLIVISFLSAL